MTMYPLLAVMIMGSWFLVIPHALFLCPPDPLFESIYLKLNLYFIAVCIVGYLLFVRRYNRRGMSNNPEVWDFENMKYSPSKPLEFRNKKDAKLFKKFSKAYVAWSVSVAIIISSSSWYIFKNDGEALFTENMVTTAATYFIAYIFIGILGVGFLDTILVVLKESIKQKRKMTISEFD